MLDTVVIDGTEIILNDRLNVIVCDYSAYDIEMTLKQAAEQKGLVACIPNDIVIRDINEVASDLFAYHRDVIDIAPTEALEYTNEYINNVLTDIADGIRIRLSFERGNRSEVFVTILMHNKEFTVNSKELNRTDLNIISLLFELIHNIRNHNIIFIINTFELHIAKYCELMKILSCYAEYCNKQVILITHEHCGEDHISIFRE